DDERPGEGAEEEVSLLIDGVRPDAGEDVLADEFLPEVRQMRGGGPELDGALGQGREILGLPHVRGEGEDLHPLDVLEVVDADRGVKRARIRQGDLRHDGTLHGGSLSVYSPDFTSMRWKSCMT